ncbi:MAG: winged helix-turn-helix transcriptional regulator [Clostridiales bacterium]|nr:winged helix-turn-helix transcriptional regulator [Clostridiales bacterium]
MEIMDEFELKKYIPNKSNIKNMTSFFYAFSDDTRLKIIILLMLKELCVGEIADILNINQTTVSHQLKLLKSLNIVECERNGKNVVYYIKNDNIEHVLNASVECI